MAIEYTSDGRVALALDTDAYMLVCHTVATSMYQAERYADSIADRLAREEYGADVGRIAGATALMERHRAEALRLRTLWQAL